MKQRDREIVSMLERFGVLTRDNIIRMFFNKHKQAINSCNTVLRRLVYQKKIRVNRTIYGQSLFFPVEGMKVDSLRIPHALRIVDFYLDVCNFGKNNIITFQVEPDYGKGYPSPDVYMVYRHNNQSVPFYIEIQRTTFSKQQIADKIKRYENYYSSGLWREYTKRFPVVLVITETYLPIYSEQIKILQANNWNTFMIRSEEDRKKVEERKSKIKINKTKPILSGQ